MQTQHCAVMLHEWHFKGNAHHGHVSGVGFEAQIAFTVGVKTHFCLELIIA